MSDDRASRNGGPVNRRTRSGSFREYQERRQTVLLLAPGEGSPLPSPRRFDVTGTMNRLKSSLIGGNAELPDLEVPFPSIEQGSERYEPVHDLDADDVAKPPVSWSHRVSAILSQVPAIVLIGMFHLMIGIPFGVSYFPIGWSSVAVVSDDDDVNGAFPVAGKEALGIRMFLFSTIIGQLAFSMTSGFNNPIGLQMVENVPFCHALSHIVIKHQGYGVDALSTLFVMFGLSSIIVGLVFFLLGRLKLGRVVYYFPTHVLVGCIGGIGIFIAKTGIEVTIDAVFGVTSLAENLNLLAPVLAFELLLRFLERATLDANGRPSFSLLSPIFFCLITPVFYAVVGLFHVDLKYVNDAGYLFPSLLDDCDGATCSSNWLDSIFSENLFDMWTIIDFSKVSLPAIADSIPTLVALTLFSLIHVPINIPAFAISTGTEADMNRELVAHGYSNVIAGIFGGLQNYLAYTQSVLYHKSGGKGKGSGIAVAFVTAFLFLIGPTIASFIPRCMAGTLLLHVGIDLFLEGVYDSFGKFDRLEYAGIWLITCVMTLYGMDAAMIAGGIAAVSTYAVQSIHYVKPIRGAMSAATLRSSRWNRSSEACAVLDDNLIGRNRILVVQLQGHLFFGVIAQLMDSINKLLTEKADANAVPWIVILDFSLVLGIDSSAAQTMTKLRNVLQKSFNVEICIFVTGSVAGFPCEFDLSKELIASCIHRSASTQDFGVYPDENTSLVSEQPITKSSRQFRGSHVESSLDLALIFAEDALLARQGISGLEIKSTISSLDDKELGLQYLMNLCPGEADSKNVEILFSLFRREVYRKDDILWNQGSSSDCIKLVVRGQVISLLENEAGTSETVDCGNIIGEHGLVQGLSRMSSVLCLSDEAVLYSLSRESFDELCRTSPHVARLIDLLCIRYLSSRVQHVSK
jgi:SulP family sulfate permease